MCGNNDIFFIVCIYLVVYLFTNFFYLLIYLFTVQYCIYFCCALSPMIETCYIIRFLFAVIDKGKKRIDVPLSKVISIILSCLHNFKCGLYLIG